MLLQPTASHRYNNFDFLRFFAASLVVFGHSYPLTGRFDPLSAATHHMNPGGLAVSIFFIISGYLITGSYVKSTSVPDYLSKRVLRIYPGFFVSVLAMIFVVGPLATTLPIKDYFHHPETWDYLRNLKLYVLRFTLPGVFLTENTTPSVNGTYWTLCIEFSMYLLILALGMGRILTLRVSASVAILFLGLHCWLIPQSGAVLNMSLYFLSEYGWHFMAGSVFYHLRERIQWRWDIFGLVALLFLVTLSSKAGHHISLVLLPYIILHLSFARIPRLDRFSKYGDFSYGIYLYGFPVQQLLVHAGYKTLPTPVFFILSLLVTLAVAVLSWYAVEAPALRLKNHLPSWWNRLKRKESL